MIFHKKFIGIFTMLILFISCSVALLFQKTTNITRPSLPAVSTTPISTEAKAILDPDLTLVSKITKNQLRQKILLTMKLPEFDDRIRGLKQLLAQATPADLIELRELFDNEFSNSQFMKEWEVFLEWSLNFSPEETIRYAVSGYNGKSLSGKHLASSSAILKLLDSDPSAAMNLLQGLPSDEALNRAIMTLGQKLVVLDPVKARAWVESSESPKFRKKALESVTMGELKQGRLNGFSPESTTDISNWMLRFASEDYAVNAFKLWTNEMITDNPKESVIWAQWLIDLPDGPPREASLNEFFRRTSQVSPETLIDWMLQIEGNAAFDQAAAGMIDNLLFKYDGTQEAKQSLLNLTAAISDKALRNIKSSQVSAAAANP